VANKVTHIVNCAAREVSNHWQPIGVRYLCYNWLDSDAQTILDEDGEVCRLVSSFISEALEQGESVLVHSVRGQSRAMCVTAAYLMGKYRWSLTKTFEFLNSRRPDFEIKSGFVRQLQVFEARFFRDCKPTSRWVELSEAEHLGSEELMLRNTFLNSQALPISDVDTNLYAANATALKWSDHIAGQLADHPHPASKNPVDSGFAVLKSCLKGGRSEFIRVPLANKRTRPTLMPESVYMTGPVYLSPSHRVPEVTSPKQEVKRPSSVNPRESASNEDRRPRLLTYSPITTTKLHVREGQSITTKGPVRAVNDGIRPTTDNKIQLKKRRPVTAPTMRPPSPISRKAASPLQKYSRPQWR
jgi:protein-tyrosine phosphatase